MIVIPAVDIKGGKVVRLYQGDFSQESRYSWTPVQAALHWQKLGAKLIHIVDLDGALEGEPKNKDILLKIIRQTTVDIEVGGGLRDTKIINELITAGVKRVVLGSKVFSSDYSFLDNFKTIVAERIAVSIDSKFISKKKDEQGRPWVEIDTSTAGWLESKTLNLEELLEAIYEKGIRFVNFTSIQRDGTLKGPDLAAIEDVCSCVRGFTGLNLIASGGIASLSDIRRLKEIKGLYGVIVGKALYEGKVDLKMAIADTVKINDEVQREINKENKGNAD